MWKYKNRALLTLALLIAAASTSVRTQPATITVCAANCTYNNTQLQTAMNNALAGDLILIQEGHTYTGTFTAPVKTGAGPAAITRVRTGVDANGVVQSTTRYPAPNKRICPSGYVQDWYDCATRSPQDMTRLAKITPSSNNLPALTNADTGSGTPVSYWHFEWIEFIGNTYGGSSLIVWSNDTLPADTGTSLMMPDNITMNQVVIRGRPVEGQFRGMQIDTRTFALTNSHVQDIKAISEGQAIWSNGVGPYTFTNNYACCGTETFFTGGGGTLPEPILTIDTTPTPTVNTFNVTGTMTDLHVEKQVAIFYPPISVVSVSAASDSVVDTAAPHNLQVGWEVDFDDVVGCGTTTLLSDYPRVVSVQDADTFTIETNCTTTGSGGTMEPRFSSEITAINGTQITVSPDLPFVPPNGSWIHTGMTIRNMTVRYNVFTRPASWYTTPRIVALPTGTAVTCSTTGGTLPAATYGYRVLARHKTAGDAWADSGAAAEASCAVASGTTGRVTVTWAAVPNATEYLVYGRTPGGQTRWWSAGSATTWTDTGSDTGSTVASVDTSASRWGTKNTFELKNCNNCTIEYNIIENSWVQGQVGQCVLFTPTQQNNNNFSSSMRDIVFRYNEVRHCGQAVQLTGSDAGGDEAAQTRRVTISHNLFWDIGGEYNGASPAMIFSPGGQPRQNPNRSVRDLTVTHNTIGMDKSNDYTFALYFNNCNRELAAAVNQPIINGVFRDNVMYSGTYGVASEDAAQSCTWIRGRLVGSELTGASVFNYNVLAGASSCSTYVDDGAANTCPSITDLESLTFTGPSLTNRLAFRIKDTSPYYGTASDATNYGADIGVIDTAMVITESGDNSGGGVPAPLTIPLDATLIPAVVGTYYEATFTATGGTLPYTWAHTTGTLPTGLSFDPATAKIYGIPSAATTNRSFTIRVTDAANVQTSKVFTLTVQRFSVRQSRYNWSEGAFFVRPTAPENPGEQVRLGDLWYDTATSSLKKAVDIGPPIVWEPVGGSDLSNLNASNLTSGTVPLARLGSGGTPGTTTFLRGDNTWATPAGGGGGGFSTVVLGADVATTATTFSNITGLSFEMAANTGYDLTCVVRYTSAASTTGLIISWTGPASPTFTGGLVTYARSSAGTTGGHEIIGNDSGTVVPDTQTPGAAVMRGMWINGATAGTLQLRFRSEISGSAITAVAGSRCRYTTF